MQPTDAPYPATFTFDPPERIANWRPLVHWLLAIPHFVILYGLRILAQVVAAHLLVRDPLHGRAARRARERPGDVPAVQHADIVLRGIPRRGVPAVRVRDDADGRRRPACRGSTSDPSSRTATASPVAFRIILVIPHLIEPPFW